MFMVVDSQSGKEIFCTG